MRKSIVMILMVAAFGTAFVTTSCKGQRTGTNQQMQQQTPRNDGMQNNRNERSTQPQAPPQRQQPTGPPAN